MVLEIVQTGDPVLRNGTRDLSPDEIRSADIQTLIAQMRDTMRDAPGVGLAAPQIGLPLRIAVIEDPASYQRDVPPEDLALRERSPVDFHVIVNPRIVLEPGEPVEFVEGCLSVAGFAARVKRARVVHVEALDERGEPVRITARGWYARILQHEIDHLDGVLYIDRMDTRTFANTSRRSVATPR